MSNFDNKTTRSVADAVLKIMSEKALHPNQQKLDVHEPEKDELTTDDFKKLRAMKKEETEQLQEYESKNGSYTHKGTYGYAGKGAEHGETDYKKANDDEKSEAKPARRKYGARQNFKRSTRVNESFTDMFESFKTGGLKGLEESMKSWKKSKDVKEEVDSDTFKKEIDDQQAKSEAKKKGADVAKPAVQAVQQEETHTEIEVIDLNDVNGVQIQTIELDERELTDAETGKKEEIVKSMKKNLQGFKDRYGKDAKSVMYATATKQAKGE